MSINWRGTLLDFAADRRSGSNELAAQAAEILREYFAAHNLPEAIAGLSGLVRTIIESQPSMAAVINTVNRICLAVEDKGAALDNPAIEEIFSTISSARKQSQKQSIGYAAGLLRGVKHVCTYSRSSMVETALLQTKKEGGDFSVVLSEARPGGEGITLAKNLAGAGVEVELCVDAALPGMLEECDCLILGADAVTGERFLNKIGSAVLYREALRQKTPVYIIANYEKFLPPELEKYLRISDLSHETIFDLSHPSIRAVNRLFEWCLNERVDFFIGDFGRVPGCEIGRHIKSVKVSAMLASRQRGQNSESVPE